MAKCYLQYAICKKRLVNSDSVTNSAKRAERGWQKYLWDSPMEQTEKNGEAMSSNKGSTAHYHG